MKPGQPGFCSKARTRTSAQFDARSPSLPRVACYSAGRMYVEAKLPNNAVDRTTFQRRFAALRSADAAGQRGR